MYTTIATCDNPLEAHIIRGRLEFEGMPTILAFDQHIWANWSFSLALGGVRLQVPSTYSEEAKEVLLEIRAGSFEQSLNQKFPKVKTMSCPQCGCGEISRVTWLRDAALTLGTLFAFPIPYTNYLMQCSDCSRIWIHSSNRGNPLYICVFAIVLSASILVLSVATIFIALTALKAYSEL